MVAASAKITMSILQNERVSTVPKSFNRRQAGSTSSGIIISMNNKYRCPIYSWYNGNWWKAKDSPFFLTGFFLQLHDFEQVFEASAKLMQNVKLQQSERWKISKWWHYAASCDLLIHRFLLRSITGIRWPSCCQLATIKLFQDTKFISNKQVQTQRWKKKGRKYYKNLAYVMHAIIYRMHRVICERILMHVLTARTRMEAIITRYAPKKTTL